MKTFQIRDGSFGLALYEASTPEQALLDFVADRVRGELRAETSTGKDGIVQIVYGGVTYRAVPAD